jgi:hypothetical protein
MKISDSSLRFSHLAANSVAVIVLLCSAASAQVVLSSNSVNFGTSVHKWTVSSAQTVTATVTASATSPIYICSVTAENQNFSDTTSLAGQFPVQYTSSSTFTINLRFFPTTTELIYGGLSVGYSSSQAGCNSTTSSPSSVYANLSGTGASSTNTGLVIVVPPVLPTATDSTVSGTTFDYSAQFSAVLNGVQDNNVTWSITGKSMAQFVANSISLSGSGTLTASTAGSASCSFPPVCIFMNSVTVKAVDGANSVSGTFFLPVYAVDTSNPNTFKANCNATSVDVANSTTPILPINDLGTANMQYCPNGANCQSGYLYDTSNSTDTTYQNLGISFTNNINLSSQYIFAALGFSNPNLEFAKLTSLAKTTLSPTTKLSMVDAAEGSVDAACMSGRVTSPCSDPNYWATNGYVDNALGHHESEVVAVWLKVTNANDTSAFPTDATNLQCDIETIITGHPPTFCPTFAGTAFIGLKAYFQNLQFVYVSSRSYAGYHSNDTINPEPYSYETGFANKWAVHDSVLSVEQTKLPPWVGWGPYFWTNGLLPRSDDLTWTCQDVKPLDGRHPTDPSGQLKTAVMLLNFLKTDTTATPWFK